jgi:hypothetical protein
VNQDSLFSESIGVEIQEPPYIVPDMKVG